MCHHFQHYINVTVQSAINRNTVIFPLIIMGNHGASLYKFGPKRKISVITYHIIEVFIC